MKKIAIIGNPNSGKTTIFNAITNSNNKTANWPGVTVDVASASWKNTNFAATIIDLPGLYSISHADFGIAADEKLAADYLFYNKIDFIINVVDASNLSRSLYLSTQLIETGIPLVIVLNKIDIATEMAVTVNRQKLQQHLQTRIITATAIKHKQKLINDILNAYIKNEFSTSYLDYYQHNLKNSIAKLVKDTSEDFPNSLVSPQSLVIALLSGNKLINFCSISLEKKINSVMNELKNQQEEDIDVIVAQNRYDFIHKITTQVQQKLVYKESKIIEKIDTVLTHKYYGLPSLIAIIYLVFYATMQIGTALQIFFENIAAAIFIEGARTITTAYHFPKTLQMFVVSGLGQGFTSLAAFIPIVFCIFYSMQFLEETGYMPRAAYVTDRVMRLLQLPGKAFIPLIMGFGCNVPAILASRTLESKRERILAGMMTPFMSCNARLAVFAIFASAYFPLNSSMAIFSLYMVGIVVAIITGIIMCRLILPGTIKPLVLELPKYQLPKQKALLKNCYLKTLNFCTRVGKYIFMISAVIGIANSITWQDSYNNYNLLEAFGRAIQPMLEPIGIKAENWPAAISIISGFVAKETVIITLSQLYSHTNDVVTAIPISAYSSYLSNIISSSWHDLAKEIIPWASLGATNINSTGVLNAALMENFSTNAAISYVLFNLLYTPCISTVVAFAKEVNWRWATLSVAWSITIAYTIATIFFQISTGAMSSHALFYILICLCLNFALAYNTRCNEKTAII